MQKQSEIALSQNGLTTSSIERSVILKEQTDKKEVLKTLVYLLNRIAKLYQIPNFDNENAVLLASWINETYKYDPFDCIESALTNPGPLDSTSYRLTPDVVSEWIAIELDKRATQLESEHKKNKAKTIEFELPEHAEELSEETNRMIQDFINDLSKHQKPTPITSEMIQEMGKERIKPRSASAGHLPCPAEYLAEKELKKKWMLECFDLNSGKPNENWMSWEEYKLI